VPPDGNESDGDESSLSSDPYEDALEALYQVLGRLERLQGEDGVIEPDPPDTLERAIEAINQAIEQLAPNGPPNTDGPPAADARAIQALGDVLVILQDEDQGVPEFAQAVTSIERARDLIAARLGNLPESAGDAGDNGPVEPPPVDAPPGGRATRGATR